MQENFSYKNPDGIVTEYRFVNGRFVGLFNDGVKKEADPIPIGTELSEKLRENLGIAGFKLKKQPKRVLVD